MTAKTEQAHLDAVADLGCWICAKAGYPETPAEIHHVRTYGGARIKRNHLLVLPLCPFHHRTGPHGFAFHAGSREWQRIHGTETQLLAEVYAALAKNLEDIA